MKGKQIGKAIGWGILAAVLLCVLVAVLSGKFSSFSISSAYQYSNWEDYTAGGGSVAAGDVRAVEINWIDGNVTVKKGAGPEIVFYESQVPAEQQMYYLVRDGKLTIQPRQSESVFHFGIHAPQKDLTVEIPEECVLQEVSIDTPNADADISDLRAVTVNLETISGNFVLRRMQCDSMNLESTSGSIQANSMTVNSMEIDSVSGDCMLEGAFRTIGSETVSGQLDISSSTSLENLEVDSVSGDMILTVPKENGFTLTMDSVSGEFECAFPTQAKGDRWIYGDGSGTFALDSVSGSVTILSQE